jgi:hypothetical protein
VRIYGIRHWIEQGCKQVKDELGWAGFQVRSDVAIRRHQALVNCAFSFCWDARFHSHPAPHQPAGPRPGPSRRERGPRAAVSPPAPSWPRALRAIRAWLSPGSRCNAGGRHGPQRPATAAAGFDQLGRGRLRPAPLHPELTNYR